MSSSLAYPASSSSRASFACTAVLGDRWLGGSFAASTPRVSVMLKVGLNWFDGCPPTGVETDDELMMDSPNAESVWPSLLLKSKIT